MLGSDPLEDFRRAYFGPYDHYLGWHDGYDTDFGVLYRLPLPTALPPKPSFAKPCAPSKPTRGPC